MDEKPRNSAEILNKDLIILMIIQVAFVAFAFQVAYTLCSHNILALSPMQQALGPTMEGTSIDIVKARTMALLTLFILESLIMPMQIRRMNHSIIESFRDIDYKTEFLFYIPSILILVIAIYYSPLQTLFAGSSLFDFTFVPLDWMDWLAVILLCLPNLIGFELVRYYARKHNHYF
jgi:magnesium-transporting ATPase (P-type)